MKKGKIILNGIINENPTFVLFLGMCPVLATSVSIYSAIGMSVCVFLVLLLSNIIISLVGKITPDEVRIPVYIVIIATIVTIVSMFTQAFAEGIYSTLGSYLQLIVVNCIILGRAEAFASKNSVIDSIMDAIGISIGFLMAMVIVAAFREILGTGNITFSNLNGELIFGKHVIPLSAEQAAAETAALEGLTDKAEILKVTMGYKSEYAISLLAQPAGAFLVLGLCVAGFTAIKGGSDAKKAAKAKKLAAEKAAAAKAAQAAQEASPAAAK